MLIKEKLPGSYPQITHAPITSYADFLNFFRGGHTIDDNLAATSIASTMQAGGMLRTAIASGHLTKVKNMAIPSESLADITLTESGAELIQTVLDREFCEMAVGLARKSIAESDGEPHPYVGAVVVKDGKILATGYRGETGEGRHAEYCALRKINNDVDNVDLSGCTVYTTLEPCSTRKPGKTPCTNRLINGKVARVVYGLADKDETVFGHSSLSEADIEIGLFPKALIRELHTLNKDWSDTRRKAEVMPPPNRTGYLADVQYNKPGTPMTDNIHVYVRPPKDASGFFTVEDNAYNVLAYARTFDEIAVKWHRIDDQKVILEKMRRVSSGSTDLRLGF
jgi:pyrimidine deaminase RibD-like protein